MDTISAITAFDALVLVIVGLSAVIGFARGFSTEILTLAAWAGAIFATLYGLSWGVTDFGRSFISPDALSDVVTAVTLFFLTLFLFKYLAGFIGRSVKSSAIGFLDRSLGALFGIIRGVLVTAAIFLVLDFILTDDRMEAWTGDAQLKPFVAYSAKMMAIVVPNLLERSQEEEETKSLLETMKENMPPPVDFLQGTEDDGFLQAAREMLDDTIDDLTRDDEEEDGGN